MIEIPTFPYLLLPPPEQGPSMELTQFMLTAREAISILDENSEKNDELYWLNQWWPVPGGGVTTLGLIKFGLGLDEVYKNPYISYEEAEEFADGFKTLTRPVAIEPFFDGDRNVHIYVYTPTFNNFVNLLETHIELKKMFTSAYPNEGMTVELAHGRFLPHMKRTVKLATVDDKPTLVGRLQRSGPILSVPTITSIDYKPNQYLEVQERTRLTAKTDWYDIYGTKRIDLAE